VQECTDFIQGIHMYIITTVNTAERNRFWRGRVVLCVTRRTRDVKRGVGTPCVGCPQYIFFSFQKAVLECVGTAADPPGADLPGQLLAQQLQPPPRRLPAAGGPPGRPHLSPPGGGGQGGAPPPHHHSKVFFLVRIDLIAVLRIRIWIH
jgi:hypothetical protein